MRPKHNRQTQTTSQNDVFHFFRNYMSITYYLDNDFFFFASCLIFLYITMTAMQNQKIFMNVVSRVIWNQPEMTQAKLIAIIFFAMW